ncbi:uncharacterized protein LOC143215256 [Lasioglossum baleicum]|uniref:uncharacterized protein LOC143215256 n=1 Tax=Lasioglossum baleicum TaxID=434251 RepID=UPI003FCE845B
MEDFKKMEQLAIKHQQFYYELLPDWFLYKQDEHDYILQRIRFALYGTPEYDGDKQLIDNQATDSSTNRKYDKQKRKTINNIYEKILECRKQDKNYCCRSVIYMSVIYNIAFKQNASSRTSNEIYALPIFKIKVDETTVWYIDNTGRVYKSWEDYLKNNTLSKCMMVIPKDGVYQCNPHCTVTKRSSTVWTHMVQSPACGTAKLVVETIDIASSVTGVATAVAIGIASLFTPIGPVVTAAGLVSSFVTGGWNISRGIERLVDRSAHEESICPSEGAALSAWFGITSSVLGIGSNGGTMLLLKAIAKGSSISNAAKIAFDSLLISNLTVNGCGIVFQGYRLIDEYQTNKRVDIFDIVMFSSQVLFFSNSLLNMKLANELIGTSNGTILEKFKNMLRFERLEQQYNKIIGKDVSKRIIHRLTRMSNVKDFLANHDITLQFGSGVLVLNGIRLIDPYFVAERLLISGAIAIKTSGTGSLLTKTIVTELKSIFVQLVTEFISQLPSALNEQSEDFNQLLVVFNEMAEMNNGTELLKMIFKISTRMLSGELNSAKLLQYAILFVWEYCKANVIQIDKDKCSPLQGSSVLYNLLTKIVTNLADFIDQLADNMYSAFYSYMSSRLDVSYNIKISN